MTFNLLGKRVWVAGHNGMLGSAIVQVLKVQNQCELLLVDRSELDLRRQADVEAWMQFAMPEVVILAAATVGGILVNDSRPVDFLYDNLAIEMNVIAAAHERHVEKLLFLGSSCVYPPWEAAIPPSALLQGRLEPTNEWYAIAKIAGIKLCQAIKKQYGKSFISAMPTNLYGPGDNFDLDTSHVVPAIMRKMHEAKLRSSATVTVWGTGRPRREFMHVTDCADALVHVLQHYDDPQPINIGTGEEVTIATLSRMIARIVGFEGDIVYDTTKPDGVRRKLLDCRVLRHRLGWSPGIELERGLENTYRWFLSSANLRQTNELR